MTDHVTVENFCFSGDDRISETLLVLGFAFAVENKIVVDRQGADLNHHRRLVACVPVLDGLLYDLELHRIVAVFRETLEPIVFWPDP